MKVDMWEFIEDYIDNEQLKNGSEITVNLRGIDICKVKVERDDDLLDFKVLKIY